MLDSIEIKDFKRIKQGGLKLNKLSKVNYLVGKNGSGKSSIIEAIRSFYNLLTNDMDSGVMMQKGSFYLKDIIDRKNIILEFKGGVHVPMIRELARNSEISISYNSVVYKLYIDEIESFYSPKIKKEVFPVKPIIILPFDDNHISSKNIYLDKVLGEKIGHGYNKLLHDILINYTLTDNIAFLGDDLSFFMNHRVKSSPDEKIRILLDDIIGNIEISVARRSSGYNYIQSLIYFIAHLYNEYGYNVFLVEEPEIHLHPSLQKMVPKILNSLSNLYNVQFITTTHSPFIISAAAEICSQEKIKSKKEEKEFIPTQKVYKIEQGKCLNPYGSSGIDMVFESAKMLGAGIDSIIATPPSDIQPKSYIIYCEGAAKTIKDSEVYNEIFRENNDCLFISCESCNDVYKQFIIGREFYKYQKAQIKVIGLVDNDPGNSKIEDWKKEGLNVLKRREIENYLYDKNIVINLKERKLTEKDNEEYNNVNIESDDLKKTKLHQPLNNLKLELAKIIKEKNDSEVYKELRECIFDQI